MRSPAHRVFIFFFIGLITLTASYSQAATPESNKSSLATLTQSTLELQKELLAAREKLLPQSEQLGLTIYLDTRNIFKDTHLEIEIELDNQTILKHSVETQPGIQKIYTAALRAGEHQFRVFLRDKTRIINKKNIELNKTNGQDIISITIGRSSKPDISIQHQQRAIGQ